MIFFVNFSQVFSIFVIVKKTPDERATVKESMFNRYISFSYGNKESRTYGDGKTAEQYTPLQKGKFLTNNLFEAVYIFYRADYNVEPPVLQVFYANFLYKF